MRENTILIVDDEKDIADLISDILTDAGFHCIAIQNSEEALKVIDETPITMVLLDIWLQDSNLDGLGILEIIKVKYPSTPVIMISGHGTIETAVNSIKMGAYDYIEKPFNSEKLVITVKRAAESIKLKRENSALKKKVTRKVDITGNSKSIVELRSLIEKVAPVSSRVMIVGSAGSGRELVAKLIHKKSSRRSHSFVKLNTSILSGDNIGKELFGSEKNKFGLIELANKGTLFINEVGDLPLSIQHKVLTFIKEQDPDANLGSVNVRDIRIICSTSRDLRQEVKTGNFLHDLYYRLNVVQINVPALKDRSEDIIDLSRYFMKLFERTANLPAKLIDEDTMKLLYNYNWPGNVRQLKNLVECLLINAKINDASKITIDMLPSHISKQGNEQPAVECSKDIISMPLRQAREIFERKYLIAQMARFDNNISKTSIFVGMERSALHRKLKMLNVRHSSLKQSEESFSVKEHSEEVI